MIVENKAGAGTSIGAAFVSREAPDGYTILMATNSTLVTNRYLYRNCPMTRTASRRSAWWASARWCCCPAPSGPSPAPDLVDYAKQNRAS